MKTKKLKTCFEILFTIGLCLAAFVMVTLRYSLLPDFFCGLLGGISACLLLGAGTLKYMVSDDESRTQKTNEWIHCPACGNKIELHTKDPEH